MAAQDWVKIQKSDEVALTGVQIEIERRDRVINNVTFTDAAHRRVKVALDGFQLGVYIPAKPETVEKFKVTATVEGIPVEPVVEDTHAAQRLQARLSNHSDGDVAVTPFHVEIPF